MYQNPPQNYSYYTSRRQNLSVLYRCGAYADVSSVYLIEFHILTDSVFPTTIQVTFAALKLFPDPKTMKKNFIGVRNKENFCVNKVTKVFG